MKFTIETNLLLTALQKASAAISNRNLLPILGNVKIEATNGQIVIESHDLDIFITQKLPAEVSEEGGTTVAHSYLLGLANRTQSTTIRISTDAKTLKFEAGEIEAILETLPVEEFPPAFKQEGDGTECEADSITVPFEKLAHAICKAERYTLMGVNILSDDKGSEFCASDGRRMAMYRADSLNLNGIVPDDLVAAVLKMDFTGPVKVSTESGFFSMRSDDVFVIGKLIEGRYVNYRQAIPDSVSKEVFSATRKDLIEAIRTCSIFVDRRLPALEIRGKGKKQLEVKKDAQATVTLLGAELNAQPQITIRFDSRFVLDALSVCEDEIARIQCFKSDGAHRSIVIEERAFKEVIGLMREP